LQPVAARHQGTHCPHCRYQQKYSNEPLPQEWLQACANPGADPSLQLPGVNPFTPHNLELLRADEHPSSGERDEPIRIVDDDMIRMLCASVPTICLLTTLIAFWMQQQSCA
jgi:secreted Zn-dependent insulinase-like peptidase